MCESLAASSHDHIN